MNYMRVSISSILPQAAANAETDAEKNFIAGMSNRYDRFGEDSVLSDRQSATIIRIAEKDGPYTYGHSGIIV